MEPCESYCDGVQQPLDLHQSSVDMQVKVLALLQPDVESLLNATINEPQSDNEWFL